MKMSPRLKKSSIRHLEAVWHHLAAKELGFLRGFLCLRNLVIVQLKGLHSCQCG